MKRQSKADLILMEARERVDAAQERVQTISNALEQALAVREAHQQAYNALERQLAPKPRKKAVKEAKEPEKKEPMCAVCANPADHPDHDTTYLSSHPFALSVPKKSGRKSGEGKSTVSTDAPLASVGIAAGTIGD